MPISEISFGETLYLRITFSLSQKPRNLVIGVPVWNEDGIYVSGFSTNRDGRGLEVTDNEKTEFMLEVPKLAFNPGSYISNIAIHDGPEFLYRGENLALTVKTDTRDKWGIVSLDHRWKKLV